MFLLSVNRGLVGWRPFLSSPTPHALRNPVDVLESAYLTVMYMIHSSTHTEKISFLTRQSSLEEDACCVS